MSASVALSVRGVDLSYRVKKGLFVTQSTPALRNISFDVYEGETLGIIGGNGSGKSTLLKVMAGVYLADSGKVVSNALSISLVSLSLGFDPEVSGISNAIFGCMLMGSKRASAINRLDKIKEFSQLGDAFHDPIKTYSAGMIARLAFSVAHFSESSIILIDEVLSVGDAEFRAKASEAMVKKIANSTTVLVSHELSQITTLCDRVLLLDRGQLVAEGEPSNVISIYKNLPNS